MYRLFLKRLFEIIVGNNANFTLDHQVLNASVALVGFIYFITVPQNLITGLPLVITIVNGTETIFIFILYYFLRIKRKLKYILSLFFSSVLITLSIDWFPMGGMTGCIPLFYLVLLAFIVFHTDRIKRRILLIIYLINLALLYYLEYHYPELIIQYKIKWVQFEDMFTAYLFCVIMIWFLVFTAKRLYQQEKKNTIDIIEQYRKHSDNLRKTLDDKISLLSLRERDVFKLIIEGKSNKEIADILHINIGTVKNHITCIYRKVDVNKRIDIINKL